jgi:hypothetical protein
MKVSVPLEQPVPYQPDIAWDALINPRADYLGNSVSVQHTRLSQSGTIRRGSQVTLQPSEAAKKRIPWPFRSMIQPIGLVVAELNPTICKRRDEVLPNTWVEGSIDRFIEIDKDDSTIIVVEANLAVNSILEALAGRLSANTSPESLATSCVEGMLSNWAALAGELAAARSA